MYILKHGLQTFLLTNSLSPSYVKICAVRPDKYQNCNQPISQKKTSRSDMEYLCNFSTSLIKARNFERFCCSIRNLDCFIDI